MSPKCKDVLSDINDLLGDTSVALKQTLEDLEEIASEVKSKIETLRADLK